MNDIYFSSLLSVCISPELDICNCFVPNSSNVRIWTPPQLQALRFMVIGTTAHVYPASNKASLF